MGKRNERVEYVGRSIAKAQSDTGGKVKLARWAGAQLLKFLYSGVEDVMRGGAGAMLNYETFDVPQLEKQQTNLTQDYERLERDMHAYETAYIINPIPETKMQIESTIRRMQSVEKKIEALQARINRYRQKPEGKGLRADFIGSDGASLLDGRYMEMYKGVPVEYVTELRNSKGQRLAGRRLPDRIQIKPGLDEMREDFEAYTLEHEFQHGDDEASELDVILRTLGHFRETGDERLEKIAKDVYENYMDDTTSMN
ncbi:MAG: hypothetical protein ABIG30_03815 [Candidatus Aenigmatarchaeota archaeon]